MSDSLSGVSVPTLIILSGRKAANFEALMSSDLEKPKWSVISERGCERSSLTHDEARRLVHCLGAEGRHGLCIISDEAASRLEERELAPESEANLERA